MDPDPRAWEPFDPDVPEDRLRLPEASVVALVPSPALRGSSWAPRTAAALARSWAEAEGRILLADLDLERPRLTAELELEAGEGVSDAFLFGASLGRIAQPVGPGLLAAPAGTAVADAEAVLSSPRWETLVDGFTEAGATLALYVPADIPGRDAVLARADAVVVLALAGETDGLDLGEAAARVEAVLGPRGGDGTDSVEAPGEELAAGPEAGVTEEPDEAAPAAESEVGSGVAEAGAPEQTDGGPESGPEEEAPVHPAAPAAEAEELPEPASAAPPEEAYVGAAPEPPQHPPEGVESLSPDAEPDDELDDEDSGWPVAGEPAPTDSPGRSRTGILIVALLVAVAAVVVAALAGLIQIPGITPADADASQAAAAAAVAPVADLAPPGTPAPDAGISPADPLPLPTEPVQGWSLTLGAFEEGAVARLQAETLSERRPDLVFAVAPVAVEGQIFHRLLAGPAGDAAGAEALRDDLAMTLDREDPSRWIVRKTPLAFRVGVFPDAAEARALADALEASYLSPYLLRLPAPDGADAPEHPGRVAVYLGAYADAAEASALRTILDEQGIDAELGPRVGRAVRTPPS